MRKVLFILCAILSLLTYASGTFNRMDINQPDLQKSLRRPLQNTETKLWGFSTFDSIMLIEPKYKMVGSLTYYSPDPAVGYKQEKVHYYHCWVSQLIDGKVKYGVVQERQYMGEDNQIAYIEIEEWIAPQYDEKVKFDVYFRAWGKLDDKWALLKNNVQITTPHYVSFAKFHCGMSKVETGHDPYGEEYVTLEGQDFETEQASGLHRTRDIELCWVRSRYGYKYLKYGDTWSQLYDQIYTKVLPFNAYQTAGVYYNGKWGILSYSGDLVTPLQYANLADIRGNKTYCYAAIDSLGNRLTLNPQGIVVSKNGPYYYKHPLEKNSSICEIVGLDRPKFGLCDAKGNIVLKAVYDSISAPDAQGRRVVIQGALKGLCSATGALVIPVQYKQVLPADNGYITLCDKNDKWRLVSAAGKDILSPKGCTDMGCCHNNVLYVQVMENGRKVYKYITTAGKDVTNRRFDGVYPIPGKAGFELVKRNGLWGFCCDGKETVQAGLTSIDNACNPEAGEDIIYLQSVDGNSELLNLRTGERMVIPGRSPRTLRSKSFVTRLGIEEPDDTTQIVRFYDMNTGRLLLSKTVRLAYNPVEGTDLIWTYAQKIYRAYSLADSSKYGDDYTRIKFYHSGYTCIRNKDRKWGIMSPSGAIIVPCTYKDIYLYYDSQNVSWAQRDDNSWDLIDGTGKILGNFGRDYATSGFDYGVCYVKNLNTNKYALLNCNGKYMTEFKWDYVGVTTPYYLTPVQCADYSAYIDIQGNEVIYGVKDHDWMESSEAIQQYLPINTRIPSDFWTKTR